MKSRLTVMNSIGSGMGEGIVWNVVKRTNFPFAKRRNDRVRVRKWIENNSNQFITEYPLIRTSSFVGRHLSFVGTTKVLRFDEFCPQTKRWSHNKSYAVGTPIWMFNQTVWAELSSMQTPCSCNMLNDCIQLKWLCVQFVQWPAFLCASNRFTHCRRWCLFVVWQGVTAIVRHLYFAFVNSVATLLSFSALFVGHKVDCVEWKLCRSLDTMHMLFVPFFEFLVSFAFAISQYSQQRKATMDAIIQSIFLSDGISRRPLLSREYDCEVSLSHFFTTSNGIGTFLPFIVLITNASSACRSSNHCYYCFLHFEVKLGK